MNIQINIEALQSYLVEDRTISFILDAVQEALNRSEDFGATVEIDKLKFGTQPPSINLISMKDIDVTLQWHLNTRDIAIPALKKLPFDAPFQAVIAVNCDSDCSIMVTAVLAYNGISPGCIKFPIKANLSNIMFQGKITIQYLGDAVIVFFESLPELKFELSMVMGGNEKLIDEEKVRDFLMELFNKWIKDNLLHPRALKFPFASDEIAE